MQVEPISTAWNRGSRGSFRSPILTDDEVRQRAPSVFAEAPHETRSQRYAYIPTVSVLTALRKEGFQPVFAAQSKTRDELTNPLIFYYDITVTGQV